MQIRETRKLGEESSDMSEDDCFILPLKSWIVENMDPTPSTQLSSEFWNGPEICVCTCRNQDLAQASSGREQNIQMFPFPVGPFQNWDYKSRATHLIKCAPSMFSTIYDLSRNIMSSQVKSTIKYQS